MQRVKIGKKKNDQEDPKWRHSTEAVEKGKVTYTCKFFGSIPVSKAKGSELIKEAIKKLQFANDIKKSEEGLKASKLKKVELCVSVQNLVLTDTKSKTTLYSFPLQRISYCADDKSSKRLFGFIARERESPQHYCYILESEKNAEELTLAVGQAFDLAYKKFKANQTAGKKEVDQMRQRVESTEKENELLKKKLEVLEKAKEEDSVSNGDKFQPTVTTSGQPSFDPFSQSATRAFESKNSTTDNPFAPPSSSSTAETFSATNSSNPFAANPQEQPTTNQGDLLNIFTSTDSPLSSQGGDVFDPLSQTNGVTSAQVSTQELPNFRPLDETTVTQSETSASLSRPKSSPISGGLLPPPPTKQSIKAAQKGQHNTSVPEVQQANETSGNSSAGNDSPVHEISSSNHQTIEDVQDGFENNLVLF